MNMSNNQFQNRVRSVDGVIRGERHAMLMSHRSATATAVLQRTPMPPAAPPQIRKLSFEPAKPKKEHRLLKRLQLPALVMAGLVGGVLMQNMLIGGILAVAYGLAALFFGIKSRTTFALAACSLAAVCALLLFKPNGELISNFSSYAFIFLVFGVITLAKESRMPKRRRYNKR